MDYNTDLPAECAVLAGIFQHGRDAYLDVADFTSTNTFSDLTNQALFNTFIHLFDKKDFETVDEASLLAAASETGMDTIFSKPDEVRYIRSIINRKVNLKNIRRWAAKLRKLEIARLLDEQLESAQVDIHSIKGDEPIEHILGLAENAIFDFTSLISGEEDSEPDLLIHGLAEHIEHIESNPVDNIGISSGYKYYDMAIGGGFRRSTVSLIGARSKIGKSMLSLNIGKHVAHTIDIPVLYLDTEMIKQDHWSRIIPMLAYENDCSITINDFETGRYAKDEFQKEKIHKILRELNDSQAPFYYKNISGKPFEDILGIMRRWVHKVVGVDDSGNTNDCLVIYDYMKLMNSDSINEGLKEYQIMGFMTTSLHNFAVRHNVPIFTLVQLNREGVGGETTAVISQSDRILWLVTNFCIFKAKSDEEIAEMGVEHGNRKIVPMAVRHGEGLQPGDYINMDLKGRFGLLTEGDLRSTILKQKLAGKAVRANGVPSLS